MVRPPPGPGLCGTGDAPLYPRPALIRSTALGSTAVPIWLTAAGLIAWGLGWVLRPSTTSRAARPCFICALHFFLYLVKGPALVGFFGDDMLKAFVDAVDLGDDMLWADPTDFVVAPLDMEQVMVVHGKAPDVLWNFIIGGS